MESLDNLVLRAKERDPEAFGLIYDEFSQKLFRFIKLKVQVQVEAEDVLQEVFIKAWQALPRFELEGSNFNAWMYRITTNTINDYFRRKYRRPETVELSDTLAIQGAESPSEDLSKSMDASLIRDALRTLLPQYREILELRFIQDFSIQETAKILKRSHVSVRVLQHRALKKLQEVYTPQIHR